MGKASVVSETWSTRMRRAAPARARPIRSVARNSQTRSVMGAIPCRMRPKEKRSILPPSARLGVSFPPRTSPGPPRREPRHRGGAEHAPSPVRTSNSRQVAHEFRVSGRIREGVRREKPAQAFGPSSSVLTRPDSRHQSGPDANRRSSTLRRSSVELGRAPARPSDRAVRIDSDSPGTDARKRVSWMAPSRHHR